MKGRGLNKRVRIADIAEKLNLSSTTVSFVLNGHGDKGISEETTKLVLSIASEMGYRPKAKTSLMGWRRAAFLTSDIANFNFHTSFFAGVYSHLQRKAPSAKLELSLLEFSMANAEERVFPDYRKVVDSGADIFLSHDRMTIDFMRGNGHKTILAQGGVAPGMICVYCDDLSAGSLAAEHAFDKGHRLAGMIFPSTESSRFTGFIDSFTKLGGVVPDKFKWVFPFNHRILEERVAAKIADAERLPTIFYCFADNIMFPVIRAFTTKGLRVPDDVSLIGTDNLYWGAYNKPAFTTVDLNEALFADKLIEAIGHAERNGAPYQLAVPVRLLERETVKRIYGRKVGGQESGVANSPAIKCLEERKYQVSRS